MDFAICTLAVIPVRREPYHKSEMMTQLLFGDRMTVIYESNGWLRIKNEFDEYEGWISAQQAEAISAKEFKRLGQENNFITVKSFCSVKLIKEGIEFFIPAGCSIPEPKDGHFVINEKEYFIESELNLYKFESTEKLLISALSYLYAPYLWGGKTHYGIDCSGLTQTVYKQNGIAILRDSFQQASAGEPVHLISEARPGDMAFFDNDEGNIGHVGILLEQNRIIHASGKVRIDKIDHVGIFNEESRTYSHKLRLIKRVLSFEF